MKKKKKAKEIEVKASFADSEIFGAKNAYIASKEFLKSYEWKKLRIEVIKEQGQRCNCCGATPADGIVINVDHIKPRKTHPELALDKKNLQVLCGDCNHGKGNWDSTDWRNTKPVSSKKVEQKFPHDIFYYAEDSETCLRWKVEKLRNRKDSIAGWLHEKTGRHALRFKGRHYFVDEIVLLLNGIDCNPSDNITHIDGNAENNRIENLEIESKNNELDREFRQRFL